MDEILDYSAVEQEVGNEYEQAGLGLRFANYFIDSLGYVAFFIGIGAILVFLGIDGFLEDEEATVFSQIIENVAFFAIIIFYYTVQEYNFKGKSLGKLITKTRAVTIDNERMDLITTIKRSAIRMVPIEPISFLINSNGGWHDRWSNTKVIKDVNWVDNESEI